MSALACADLGKLLINLNIWGFANSTETRLPVYSALDARHCNKYPNDCPFWCTITPSLPDEMHPISIRSLLLLVSLSSFVAAINITQCLADFKNDLDATGGVDPRGNPTSAAEAVGLTYQTCVERCGLQPGPFDWDEFTQLFASWLLPWLALISGLPFHSGSYMDDFISGELSFLLALSLDAYRDTFAHPTSHHECRIPRFGRVHSRPHLPQHSPRVS